MLERQPCDSDIFPLGPTPSLNGAVCHSVATASPLTHCTLSSGDAMPAALGNALRHARAHAQ